MTFLEFIFSKEFLSFVFIAILFAEFYNVQSKNLNSSFSKYTIFGFIIFMLVIFTLDLILYHVFWIRFEIIVLNSLLSLFSLFFWFFIIDRFDVFKEDLFDIFILFSGCIVVLFILIWWYFYADFIPENTFIQAVMEEWIKLATLALVIYTYNRFKKYDGFIDGIIIAGIVAISFSLIENVLYFSKEFQIGVPQLNTSLKALLNEWNIVTIWIEHLNSLVVWRSFLSTLWHIIFTWITTIWILLAFFNDNYKRTKEEYIKTLFLDTKFEFWSNKEKLSFFKTINNTFYNDDKNIDVNYAYPVLINIIKVPYNFFFNNIFFKILTASDYNKLELELSKLMQAEIIFQWITLSVLSHFLFNYFLTYNYAIFLAFFMVLILFYFKSLFLFQNILQLNKKNLV